MKKKMSKALWIPKEARISASRINEFQKQYGPEGSYMDLHAYSVRDKEKFWSQLWDYSEVIGEKGERILLDGEMMPGAKFFPDAKINFAENLLRYNDDQLALVSLLENGDRRTLSYKQLGEKVEALSVWMRKSGIGVGDRVVALLPNIPETIITMLAATSVGATFSSCSPDFGAQGVLDRFGQVSPKLLVACSGYFYNGKSLDSRERVRDIVKAVSTLEKVLCVDLIDLGGFDIDNELDFESACSGATEGFKFHRGDFNHPLYIMYSSGTTGSPKCIVHGAGGTLLQHLKEHQLHLDLRRSDVLFYFTTCGWMMWNWLVSGLASGSTLVLYDGSPFYPAPTVLLDLIDNEKITIFGTSAKYIASLEKEGVKPRESHDLSTLQTILSTGSPLSEESFKYVYRDIKKDLCLSSISGGTDIISCFALGNTTLPVYEGELQCAGLGMDVKILDEAGQDLKNEKGELVCISAFPAMPLGFWNDASGERYHAAYFERFPNIWAQGDYGEQTSNHGFIIHGRSDAVLNPGGVRIGTAEIYRQVEKVDEVIDSICVGQEWEDDVRVILFVVLRDACQLDEALMKRIKLTIRENTTPRHVPFNIYAVPAIPRTISGKIVELAVRNVIHGLPVTNIDAMANPEALSAFKNLVD
ncbi:MAG: acetoacetyl-CoA synthetase [Candidatus Azotimanducaceae bacterium]|jgi:acetoacetyl-CoA synthetase